MAKQVIKLGLEFDTKAAIQSYRDLVSELSKGGADPKAIKQFTSAIEKAETELAQLAAEGSTGFTDSKGIEQYQKKVLKTVTSMQQLALRMQEFSKSGDNFPTSEVKKLEAEIEKLKKKITDAQKAAKEGLVKSLTTNGGFSKKDAEIIAETVKTEEQLIAKLEEEKKLRDEIRKAAQPAAEKATNAIKDKAVARATSGSQIVMNSVGMKGRKGVKAIREAVATSLQEGIKEGWKAEDIKKNALDAMKQAGISEKLAKEFEASFDLKVIEKELKRVNDDIAKNSAVKKYNEANKSYNQVASGSTENYSQFIVKSKEAEKAQEDLAVAENQVSQAALNSANAQKKNADSAGQQATKAEQAANSFMQMSDAQKENLKSTEALEGGFNRLADRLKYMFGFTAMFNKLRQVIRSTFNDMQQIDKAYASIAYVTNETVADLWSTYGDYAAMAEKLGQSTADVIKASAIYRQQGLDTTEALELTTDTMKLATIAGNDYSTATQEMTAALRGFKMEMDEGSHVSDVYSELAAHAAASVDDIAQAMSRTASIANSAGMSFENTSAFLTQMIETTQESAENIGTSMKTIIARFTELKENVAGTADSEFDDLDFNKVDKALKTVGVALKDTTGQFRNLDDVFLELSGKWASLDRNTQRYIATVAAGSRQQSRFIALMDNYDRTVELINTAADSEGKADEQFSKAADTFEFKLNAIKTKWEEFKLSIMDSGFVKGLLDTVNSVMDRLKNVKMPQIAIFSTFAIMAAKNFALNFINTLKTTAKNFQQIGKAIGDKIADGLKKKNKKFKLSLELDILKQDEEKIKNKIKEITSNSNMNTILLNVKATGNGKEMFEQLKQTFIEGRTEAEAEALALQVVSEAFNKQAGSAKEAAEALALHSGEISTDQQELSMLEQQLDINHEKQARNNLAMQRSQAVSSALTQTFHALIASISAVAAGTMETSEAVEVFGKTSVASIGNIAMSIVSTTVATQGLSAGFGALATAVWSALWPLLAIAAAVGGLAAIIYTITKNNEMSAKAIDVAAQLEQATNKLSDARERLNDTKTELSDLQDAKTEVESLTKEYEKLHKQKIKTVEESEREKELAKEIKEKYPEIVTQINNENDTIEFSNSLLDIKLDKMDAEIEKQKELLRLQGIEVQQAKNEVSYYEGMNSLQSIFGKDLKMGDSTNPYEFTAEDILIGGKNIDENVLYGSVGQSLAFAEAIGMGEFHSLDEMDESQKEALISAMNHVFGNSENYKVNSNDAQLGKYADNINQLHEDVIKIRQDLKDYDGKLENAKNSIDALDKDMPEWEKTIRAGNAASQWESQLTGAQLKQEGKFNADNYSQSSKKAEQELKLDFVNMTLDGEKISASDVTNMKGIKNSYEEIYDEAIKGINTDDDWDDIVARLQGNAKNLFLSWFPSEEAWDKFTEDGAMSEEQFLKETTQKYYEDLQKYIQNNYLGVKDEDVNQIALAMSPIQEYIAEGGNASFDEMLSSIQNYYDLIKDVQDEQYYETLTGILPKEYQLDALENTKNILESIFNLDTSNISMDTAQALINAYSNMAEKGKIGGEEYLNSIYQMLEKNQIPKEQWAEWFAVDWTKITNQEDFDKFKEKQVKHFKQMGYEDAEVLFNEMQDYAKKYGILNISIETDADYQKFINSLDTMEEKVKSLGDSIISVTKEMHSNGEVSYNSFEKLKKTMEELNIDIYDYFSIDNTGKITANEEQLKKLYEAQIQAKKQKLEQTLAEERLAQAQIDDQISILKGQVNSLENGNHIILSYKDQNEALIPQVENWKKIVELQLKAANIEEDLSDFSASSSISFDVSEENKEALKQQLLSSINSLELQSSLKKQIISTLENELSHAPEEVAAEWREWQHQIQEAAAATDNLAKKQEDLAKAQKDVADKQKKLNEAIQEYNDLIYGSKNRKSSLDLLYNYKEAISAFSDELTRAKELFEDSSSFDEANKNLDRYLAAAHNSMAEYAAQNEVLKIGLEKRKNNLLNGGTSYEGVNVRFGDYVKIDERTGLAAIDQRLLQEARFADKWKDQLESFVDDYNKYSQELLKNEDAMRKMEKEIQQMRMDATKKWADFEKDIAETLKNEYQEEVNQLKEKYESMKDADDDYLNALQEAIDKQRKLRDKEKKWDDLAKKEKKLSLMNRDTSGANQIDRLKMQQEIEQDRESLLDESIDEVIENMGKIYESQQELRDSEIELKEALLDDALYWNLTAQNVSESFTSVDEFLAWSVEHHKEYLEMTDAQKQEFLDQEQQKFDEAIQASAILAKEQISEVTESIQINSEEINRIVETTGEAYINETQRVMNETEDAMRREIQTAIDKINDAKTALDEANQKLLEASQNINQIAEQLANLQVPGYTPVQTFNQNFEPNNDAIISSITGAARNYMTNGGMEAFMGQYPGQEEQAKTAWLNYVAQYLRNQGISIDYGNGQLIAHNLPLRSDAAKYEITKWVTQLGFQGDASTTSIGGSNPTQDFILKYASGGLVNYTGPAWVDGTPNKPEAFLSAEDTERIGNAAKLLSNIPMLSPTANTNSNNSFGDTNIEINLNIDHISSDVDVDEMLERVKQEIVEVARPIGTNVILQQQV